MLGRGWRRSTWSHPAPPGGPAGGPGEGWRRHVGVGWGGGGGGGRGWVGDEAE